MPGFLPCQDFFHARISICHDQIKSANRIIDNAKQELSSLIDDAALSSLIQFLQKRAYSVRNNIKARHDKKLNNLKTSHNCPTDVVDKNNWVFNLSKKPLLPSELLEKGPKFAPTPSKIPFKDFVAEIEASISYLPDESKDQIRTSAAAILQRASLPNHNISKEESKALHELKKDRSRVIMKADKGNCLVVLDREVYDSKMESLLADRSTYEVVTRSLSVESSVS